MRDLFSLGTTLIAQHEAAGGGGHEGGGHPEVSWIGLMLYAAFTLLVIFVFMTLARRGFNSRIFKSWWAQRSEQLYLFLENMAVGIIGPQGRKFMPFIMTLWVVIFFSNVIALFMPYAPSADLSWNLGMAVIVVAYVQWAGMSSHYEAYRAKGRDPITSGIFSFFAHLRHFAGPSFGKGVGAIVMTVIIAPMIFAIEIVSELMKNLSLSLRLYGNIHGGHQAVESMNAIPALSAWLIPAGFFLIIIKLLTCIVQAMLFALLTCVYISLVTHHEDHEDHSHGDHGHDELAAAH